MLPNKWVSFSLSLFRLGRVIKFRSHLCHAELSIVPFHSCLPWLCPSPAPMLVPVPPVGVLQLCRGCRVRLAVLVTWPRRATQAGQPSGMEVAQKPSRSTISWYIPLPCFSVFCISFWRRWCDFDSRTAMYIHWVLSLLSRFCISKLILSKFPD